MDTPLRSAEETENDAHHVKREKKIGDPTIGRLLRSARRVVEETAWEDGLVWYPKEVLGRVSPPELAGRVMPETGTPAGRACAGAIRRYTGKPLTEKEARDWLAGRIGERLDWYILQARSKINEIRLVVTESEIEVRAERPDTTLSTVGPLPFSGRHVRYD